MLNQQEILLRKKETIRAADAKEVGVGNPAEETYRYPNQIFSGKLRWPFFLSTSYSVRAGLAVSFGSIPESSENITNRMKPRLKSHLFQSLYFTMDGFSL